MPEMDSSLTDAYETCRRMHRRHDPTYYWATRRLPREVRPATHALYGYVRTADQIVDGPRRPPTPEARRATLDAWERELHAGGPSPIVRALVDAAGRHDLPLGELDIYMRSMRIDCAPVRMRSWEELISYMDGSAGSVGRIMAPLLGVPEHHRPAYGQLGIAFLHRRHVRRNRRPHRRTEMAHLLHVLRQLACTGAGARGGKAAAGRRRDDLARHAHGAAARDERRRKDRRRRLLWPDEHGFSPPG